MLTWKLQYFGHLMQITESLEKTLILVKIEGRKRRGWQRMRWLDGIAHVMDMSLSGLCELVMDRGAWCAAVHAITKNQTQLSNWTELNWTEPLKWASSGSNSKRICLQCRRCRRLGLDSWVGKSPWRREWLPTPVFLPQESHGQRSLMVYRPWDWKELDMTEQLTHKRACVCVCTHTHLWLSFGLPRWPWW